MNFLQKLFSVDYLSKMVEFDRSSKDDKIESMFYNSDNKIASIEKDIDEGIGIKESVEFAIHEGEGLLFEGCHRIVAAKNKNLEHIPTKIILKGRLSGGLKSRKDKFKKL